MLERLKKGKKNPLSLFVILGIIFLQINVVSDAKANSSPNSFTVQGQSWVNVPDSERIYLENFGGGNRDDAALRYVASGVTCTYNSVTANGPFLTPVDLNQTHCTQNGSAYDPINDSSRLGSLPIGFSINFYGTNYTSLWPSTNGGVYFDSPKIQYEDSLPHLAFSSNSSVLFPLGADQVYRAGKSNFWMAQTTVNSKPAFVLSWEKFDTWGNANEKFSYQLVFLNLGSGDFDAWFNYDELSNFDNQFGYYAPYFIVDANSGVNTASDLVTGIYSNDLPTTCTSVISHGSFGTLTSNVFSGLSNYYFKLENASTKSISLWTDPGCTSSRIDFTTLQNEGANGKAFYELYVDDGSKSLAIGWSIYDGSTITTTELIPNSTIAELINGGTDQIISKSINTTTPGRFIIGQRSGVTTNNVESDIPVNSSSGGGGSGNQAVPVLNICNNLKVIVNFEGGSSKLTKAALRKLKDTINEIKKCEYKNVKIVGYTSIDKQDSPNYKIFRKNLSDSRALNVKLEIESKLGKEYKNINYKLAGLSEKNPLKSNKYEKTRKSNRRVEILITK